MSHAAIVILNYNGEKFLKQFLPGVLRHSGNAEVIVADNRSTDGSLVVLQQEFPQVRVIALDNNYGFCGGYNRALKQVEADYYVLLNSDVEVTPGWLAPLIKILDADEQTGAVQPKVLAFGNRNKFEYAGAGGGYLDALGYPFCRGRVFDYVEEDRGQYNDVAPIFWATGACLVIRSSLYHTFGGLDEDFFAHMEEIDLCWKLQRAGSRVVYCGVSTVYHVGAGTLGYNSPRKTYLNFRNGLTMITKHFDTWELFVKLPARILLDWTAAVVFLAKGQSGHARAVASAHIDYFKILQDTLRKRRAIRLSHPHYSRKCIYQGVALVDYFILGRKTITPRINNPR